MMSRFEEIMKGLDEAIGYEKGNLKPARISNLCIAPIPDYGPQSIKRIRNRTGLSQSSFALCMGVSKKAVEAWEGGRSTPDGAARRTLGLIDSNPDFFVMNHVQELNWSTGSVTEQAPEYGSSRLTTEQVKTELENELKRLQQLYEKGGAIDFSKLRSLVGKL